MKIVQTDNFGGDYPDECFVTGLRHSLPLEKAQAICKVINEQLSGESAPRWWTVVDDDYKLAPGFES